MRAVLPWPWLRGATAACLLAGCAAPDRATPPPGVAPSKASLYGDAALVPTRAGEHARAELALSGELQRVTEALPAVQTAAVSVRLPASPCLGRATQPADTRAVVSLALALGADPDATRTQAERLALHWLGPHAVVEVVLAHTPQPQPHDPLPLPMLALALLGLGASGGIAVDRALDRQRRRVRKRLPVG